MPLRRHQPRHRPQVPWSAALAFDPRDIDEAPDALPNGQPRPAPTERAENPALVFSAAQQDQTAKEMPLSGTATEPHGAFTAALLEALEALPADTPASLVYERVRAVLEGSSVPDQEPDLDASAARRQQPLFGGAAADSGKVRTAALQTDDDSSVWLDIGSVSGVGVGSEFTSMTPDSQGRSITLRVTTLEGIARSTAAVVTPAGAKVAPGEVFELTKWSPSESAPLRVWHWPSNLSQDAILAAAAQVQASGAALVSDPAEEPWTHVLSWDGTSWMLQKAGAASPVSLGAPLTADALKQHLPAGAKLWANLPPSREMAAELAPAADSALQMTGKMADRALRPRRRADSQGPRVRLVPQERAGGRPAFAGCARAQSGLFHQFPVSRAQRLGFLGRRRRSG